MKKIIFTSLLLLACFALAAQTTGRSAYFIDNSLQRHKLNPAYGSVKKYFGFGIGNTDMDFRSNMGGGTFFYPDSNGGLNLFLSEKVSASDFMSNISEKNTLNLDMNLSILSMGFKGRSRGKFTSFDISMRSITGINLPGDLFSFMKEGKANRLYDFSDITIKNQEMLQVSFGYSLDITDKIRAGLKLKGLMGIVQASTKIEKLQLKLSDSEWLVDAEAELTGSAKMLEIPTKNEGAYNDIVDWDRIKFKDFAPAGFGAALDFGVNYKPVDFVVLSAAVVDLGAINWNKDFRATLGGHWSYKGVDNISMGESMEEQMDGALKELGEIFKMHKKDYNENAFESVPVTINGAVQVYVPGTGLSAGLLYTRRFDGLLSWEEYRTSANLSLGKWFGISTGYAFSTFGNSFACALNLNIPGIAFSLSLDSIPSKFSKQFIPVSKAIVGVNFGLCIAW